MLDLVLFDMDGVIFEGKNFWLDLHRAMGTEKQAWQLWSGLAAHDYRHLSELTTGNLWRGRSSAPFLELVQSRRPVVGIESLFDFLSAHRIRTGIVSSGPYQLAQRAQRLFPIDVIRANHVEIDADGRFSGKVDVQVDDNDKGAVALELMHRLGATASTAAVVVDSASDLPMARLVSLAIAYDADDPALLDACTVHLATGRIAEAVESLHAKAAS